MNDLEEKRRLLALERQQLTAQMKEMVDTTRTYLNCAPPLQPQIHHPLQECESTPSPYVFFYPRGRHSMYIRMQHSSKARDPYITCYNFLKYFLLGI